MYEVRTYRENLNTDRFEYIRIIDEESDLYLGFEKSGIRKVNESLIREELNKLRSILKIYILKNPNFIKSLKPIDIEEGDPLLIKKLKETGNITDTGPMTGVAGLIAEQICLFALKEFGLKEVIVENGGDVCMKIESELNLAISAGKNLGLNNRGLKILPSDKVIGICSSSGIFGHSFSCGKADLFTVVSHDTTLSDAWATSLANKVKTKNDIQNLCNDLPDNVHGLLAIKDDVIAYKGKYKLVELNTSTGSVFRNFA